MKNKKIQIRFKGLDQLISEVHHALTKKTKSIDKKGTIFFDSPQSFRSFFTSQKLEILSAIANHAPHSLYELGQLLGRDYQAVHKDVQALELLGFIQLNENKEGKKAKHPILKGGYHQIEVYLPYAGYSIDLALGA